MRDFLTTILELLGLTLMAVAAGAVYVPAGVGLAGLFMVGVGVLEARK